MAINKQAKTWLYADLLEKPEEHALYRQPTDGGLCLYNVQQRAMANQINCFLETACNPAFKRNQYHEALYQYHVLGENIPEPELPPYFRGDFFPTIRRINLTPLSLARLGVKEIYRFLIEEITMTEDETFAQTLKPLRTELANPSNQWDRAWRLARQHKLGPHITTFLFKLLHRILPTAERVAKILRNHPICAKCRVGVPESIEHAMFDCPENHGAGTVLLKGLQKIIPNLTPIKIITLDYDVEEDLQFPIVWSMVHSHLPLCTLATQGGKEED